MEMDNDLRGMIAERAYEIYQSRGASPGREFDDWLEAERDVLSSLLAGKDVGASDEPPAPAKRARKTVKGLTATKPATRRKGKGKEGPGAAAP